MGAVQSSENELTTCCTNRSESARPEWAASLVTTPREIREKHCLAFACEAKAGLGTVHLRGADQHIRPWERERDPDIQGSIIKGVVPPVVGIVPAPPLPDGLKFCNSEAAQDIVKASKKSDCQCPARRSTGRFFCEMCKKPTYSLGM